MRKARPLANDSIETIGSRNTKVVYENQRAIEALLGTSGRRVLSRVIGLVKDVSDRNYWPLARIHVSYVEDGEIENWQYVLVTLMFDSDFEVADTNLHSLYDELDFLTGVLDKEGQDVLQRKIFFDASTVV